MIDHVFYLDFDQQRGLQEQLRESLVSAILGGGFPPDEPLPSCRKLSQQLNISRNTVALVYESLLDNGYLAIVQSSPSGRLQRYLRCGARSGLGRAPEDAPQFEARRLAAR